MKKIYAGIFVVMGLLNANAAQAWMASNGNGLVYDSASNATWTSDANLFLTMQIADPNLVNKIVATVPTITDTPNLYDTPSNSGIHAISSTDLLPGDNWYSLGHMFWYGAKAFVGYLNSINYKGFHTWMLPPTFDQNCSAYNCTNSMLGQLFYGGLGGVAGQSILTTHNSNFSLFRNVDYFNYWSGTEYTPDPSNVWLLNPQSGDQFPGYKYYVGTVWPVLSGNIANITPVAAVPEPGEWMMMLSGFGLFGFLAKRRSHKVSGV